VVYGAIHRAGQLGENGPPRPSDYAVCTLQSELASALMAKMTTAPNPPRLYIYFQYCYVWSCTAFYIATLLCYDVSLLCMLVSDTCLSGLPLYERHARPDSSHVYVVAQRWWLIEYQCVQ
jgi:hypothetical protein